MDPGVGKRLSLEVLETQLDAFRQVLTGESAADVETLRIELKWDAWLGQVRAKPWQLAPEKMEWLESQMQRMSAPGIARLERQTTYSRVAMVVPKRQMPGRPTCRWR